MKLRNPWLMALLFAVAVSFTPVTVIVGMAKSRSTASWDVLAVSFASSLLMAFVMAQQGAIMIDSIGIRRWRSPLLPWASIRRVDRIRGGISLSDEKRSVKVFYWPFGSPHSVCRYVAERLRAAGRGELVSDWGISQPEP